MERTIIVGHIDIVTRVVIIVTRIEIIQRHRDIRIVERAAIFITINARYYIGTSDLSSSFKSKMNSFEVSLAWLFNASRF